MTDGDAIRNLLGRYCELMDAADWPGVGALFAVGALADEHGTELARGAAAVEAFYAAGTHVYDGSPRTKHIVADTVVLPPAADGTVTARSSYLVLQAVDGLPLQPIITGRYVDTFAPGPGGDTTGSDTTGGGTTGGGTTGGGTTGGGTTGGGTTGGGTTGGGEDGWHFVERRFLVDLVGDLSRHLRYAL